MGEDEHRSNPLNTHTRKLFSYFRQSDQAREFWTANGREETRIL